MAFTVRNISSKAELSLKILINENYDINTKVKAVEKALEEFLVINSYKEKISNLEDENYKLNNQLTEIKDSIKTLLNFSNLKDEK